MRLWQSKKRAVTATLVMFGEPIRRMVVRLMQQERAVTATLVMFGQPIRSMLVSSGQPVVIAVTPASVMFRKHSPRIMFVRLWHVARPAMRAVYG